MLRRSPKRTIIDEQALYDMINSQIASGVSGLVPAAPAGEKPDAQPFGA
jgi:dihydrodipicolinate synthase/N-acetylneuraminate lyase